MQMEPFALDQEFRHQLIPLLSPFIQQICRFRHIGLFWTCCDIARDLSGHKTQERIKVGKISAKKTVWTKNWEIPGLQNTRMTVKTRSGVVKPEILVVVL
jgi:hypothetical protein